MSEQAVSEKIVGNSPWPDAEYSQVVFILDARNSFEQNLLTRWIEDCSPSSSAESIFVRVNSAKDRRITVEALELPSDSVVAPLRVAWLPADDALHAGPRLRDLVFGDARAPGSRKARKILKHSPHRMHLISGAPDTISNLHARFALHHNAEESNAKQAFADFVSRQADVVLALAERRLQGGRYKVPHHVPASLLSDTAYNDALTKLAKENDTSRRELLKKAGVYMAEMISKPSTFWLDVNAKFNKFCLSLGYEDEIVYDKHEVEHLRQIVRDHPSALLWTHKTYLDGMVVPKVLYDNDFPMPHTFGGANMNFPGLGFLLHRGGGIFIKRSFQDNLLYKTTLRHYIGYLMEKRFPLSWAFEGTRSRLGKLMPPRYGLLKYVLEACHETDARNIHIVPISISYDLIRDVEEYVTEQSSRGKGAESLSWFIGYVRSLARPMGKVYLDIGEPVVLESAPSPDDRLALSKIAFEVAVEANHVTPITFPSLVTMSLLGASPRALTEEEVVQDLKALFLWAETRNLRISKDFNRAYADQIEGLLNIMIKEGVVTRYDEGPETIYGIDPEQHAQASYYRNTVIHYFVNKAIIELALLKVSETKPPDALAAFWKEVDQLRDLFKFEFFYAPTEEFHQQIRQELCRYDVNWESWLEQDSGNFDQLLRVMKPLVAHATLLIYVEAYSVVASLAARMDDNDSLDEEACVSSALKFGRQAYLQRRISSESSIGKLLFKNGFQMLQSRD